MSARSKQGQGLEAGEGADAADPLLSHRLERELLDLGWEVWQMIQGRVQAQNSQP
jgi:hypothetical protein